MVIDTMVFAHALLGVPNQRGVAMGVLERAERIVVPDAVRSELANLLRQWVRRRKLPLDLAFSVMDDAEALFDRVIGTEELWETALGLAVDRDRPVAHTLFVAAAELDGSRVVSFDRRLQAAFPERVIRAEQFARVGGMTTYRLGRTGT